MIREVAKVVAIDGNHITVESQVKSSCSSCQQADNCGNGQVAKAIPHKKLIVNIRSEKSYQIGDMVNIAVPEDKLLQSALQVYCLPLLGLILFALIGDSVSGYLSFSHEFFTIIFSLLGGYVGYRCAKYLQSKISAKITPVII